jgi:acetolactate synthase small subunit
MPKGQAQVKATKEPGKTKYKVKITDNVPGEEAEIEASSTEISVKSDRGQFKHTVGNKHTKRQGDSSSEIGGTFEVVAGVLSLFGSESSNNRVNTKDMGATATARNDDKQKINAMRSGFNDNRNDPNVFDILTEFVDLPVELLKAIVHIDSKKLSSTTNTGKPVGKNFLTDLYGSIKDEVNKITSAFSIVSADAAAKQAKVVIKAKQERVKVMLKKLQSIKDPNIVQRLSKSVAALLSGPSTENANKKLKDTLDTDAVAEEAGKIAAKHAKN